MLRLVAVMSSLRLMLKKPMIMLNGLFLKKNAKKIVKSKSMVTTEVDIDPMLVSLSDDMDILETDLAEFILQVADWDEPSHIVFPALHKNRDQIREIFAKKN